MRERVILHSDCNSFFASVEETIKPELKNCPMAVCGSAQDRHGIILAKNQLAKKFNIRTAETINEAKRKCPHLVLVEPHYNKYSEFSETVNQIYHSFTDAVEPFGIDESWLDVSDSRMLFGGGWEIADRLRKYIKENVGITVSVGVSYNKLLAKMGSDYKKPDAVTEITKENFREMMYPLPVADLFMVGRNTAEALHRMGIHTIGELARSPREFITYKLGKMGGMIHSYANGVDMSPVMSVSEDYVPKSVGNGMTFRRDLSNRDDISIGVMALTDEVSSRLRNYGVKCNTLQVAIKNNKFKTVSRQKVLSCSLNSNKDIYNESMGLIDALWKNGSLIRSITVTAGNLSSVSHCNNQIDMFTSEMFYDNIKRNERIDGAVDEIRKKYGKYALFSALLIGNDIGV